MKFLPIVARELRVSARRWSTYWVRTWVALTVIMASVWIVLANLDESPQVVARYLFFSVTGGALLYCLLIGVRATADCLSEEKREGTLGLLFLTDLKGYDVVAGKLVANSLNGFYGLLAILPVVGLALLMGGLTALQVGCAAITLVNTMFLSVCIGMFASACCRSSRRAISLTFSILLLLTIGIPALGWWRAVQGQSPRPNELYFLCSPIFSFIVGQNGLLGTGMKSLQLFAWSAGVIHALAWTFLWLACLIVPRSWQERPGGARRERWRERWKGWSYGNAVERKWFRTRLLDMNAFFWLAARERLKPMMVWIVFGVVAAVWAWGYGELKQDWFNEGVYVATAFTLNSILKNWLAAEAARQLTEERQAGSLELLLVTPLSIREILRGQALALRRQFFWPVLVALVAEVAMLLAGMREAFDKNDRLVWLTCWGAGMISLVADLVALYWVGMWLGLASKNPKRAYSDTVGRVLAVPWVIFLVFMLWILLIAARGHADVSWKAFLGFWFAVGLATDIGFGFWARQKLLTEFREAATRRYQRRTAWWKRVLGKGGATSEMPTPVE
jgi:ABC-type transport system involved in cytochrome c biogenesis permease component